MTKSSTDLLRLDAETAVRHIAERLRVQVGDVLRRRGLVVAMSGGLDSSVCTGVAVRALGAARVFGLFLPERESDPISLQLATQWADQLGIAHVTEDIAPLLEACGCYRRRDAAIRRVIPEFGADWKCKVVLPADRLDSGSLSVPSLVYQPPGGAAQRTTLPADVYREIVAATNFKQRVRKMLEYFHADRLHYAVVGTPNRLEYDQGFFVKGGDGLADVKPIAHLYKTQVYAVAQVLGVPAGIVTRPPTTDTYSLAQTQEEFYFTLPVKTLDRVLAAHNAGTPPDVLAAELGLELRVVARAYKDIEQKRATTLYLHLPPLLVDTVSPVSERVRETHG